MSILVNRENRVLVQGLTGREGRFHAEQMMAYGTRIVAGVTARAVVVGRAVGDVHADADAHKEPVGIFEALRSTDSHTVEAVRADAGRAGELHVAFIVEAALQGG